jgi:predicted phage tail component-like protein
MPDIINNSKIVTTLTDFNVKVVDNSDDYIIDRPYNEDLLSFNTGEFEVIGPPNVINNSKIIATLTEMNVEVKEASQDFIIDRPYNEDLLLFNTGEMEIIKSQPSITTPYNWFKFNGKYSYTINVVLNGQIKVTRPTKRYNRLVIPGRNGSFNFNTKTYDDMVIGITTLINGRGDTRLERHKDVLECARELGKMLDSNGVLSFYDEPKRYYKASVYDRMELEFVSYTVGRVRINFMCEPESYITDDNVLTVTQLDNSNHKKGVIV